MLPKDELKKREREREASYLSIQSWFNEDGEVGCGSRRSSGVSLQLKTDASLPALMIRSGFHTSAHSFDPFSFASDNTNSSLPSVRLLCRSFPSFHLCPVTYFLSIVLLLYHLYFLELGFANHQADVTEIYSLVAQNLDTDAIVNCILLRNGKRTV